MQPLTTKQRAFCSEYVKDENRRQAALRAGYGPNAASQQAGKLLEDQRIQDLIAKHREAQVRPGDVSVVGHVMALEAIRDKALADGKYQAAATAEKARGIALGYQSGKTRDPAISEFQRWAANERWIRSVLLFGSRVHGTARDDSDVEIAVELTVDDADEAFGIRPDECEQWGTELQRFLPSTVDLDLFHPTAAPNVAKYVAAGGREIYTAPTSP